MALLGTATTTRAKASTKIVISRLKRFTPHDSAGRQAKGRGTLNLGRMFDPNLEGCSAQMGGRPL